MKNPTENPIVRETARQLFNAKNSLRLRREAVEMDEASLRRAEEDVEIIKGVLQGSSEAEANTKKEIADLAMSIQSVSDDGPLIFRFGNQILTVSPGDYMHGGARGSSVTVTNCPDLRDRE